MKRLVPLAFLLALGACADGDPYSSGVQDPVRRAALTAPSLLSDTSRLQGRPVEAARAVIGVELIADAFETDPRYMHEVSGPALHALRLGRRELRQAVGIAADAPPQVVISRLRSAAFALEDANFVAAERALAAPTFPAGGQATLARLAGLPRLPRASEAAGAAVAEISRLDSGSRQR